METKKKVLSLLLTIALTVTAVPVGIATADYADAASYKKMKITWFDVGAGDSMYMRLPNGKNVLVDGGLASEGDKIVSKLRNQDVKTIHYLISTHPDADHVGGLQSVFENMDVKRFYYPDDVKYDTQTAKNVMRLARAEGCEMINPNSGDKFFGGNGCTVKFVHSKTDYTADNEDSLALFINYSKLQVLVAGDNEKGSQEAIEKHNVDIMQLPHHGSKYATSTAFTEKFDPEYVVVSTDGHKYGHPNKEVFRRLKQYDKNIKVWRTDKKGDITVLATKKKWNFVKKGVPVGKYCISSTAKPTHKPSGGGGNSTAVTKKYVYTTATGKKYHKSRNCRGLANANTVYKNTVKKAKSMGLEPCKICC